MALFSGIEGEGWICVACICSFSLFGRAWWWWGRAERWWKIRDKVPTQKRMRNAINFCIRLLDGMLLFVGCHLCDALHFEASQRGRHTGRGPARLSFFLRSLWRRLIGGGKRENYFTFVPLLESKQIINSTRLRERISWLSTMIDFFDVVWFIK